MSTEHMHEVVLVGLSHRTAAAAERERWSVSKERLPAALAALRSAPGIEEAFVLSTCNRTEALVAGPDAEIAEASIRAGRFAGAPEGALYALHGATAAFHVFGVAAGLRSAVLGESQIQAQVKEAADAARAAATLGPTLEALLQQALRTGKRVRTETGVGVGTLSVASAAVDLIARVHSNFGGCSVLVIGAGETGLLVARHLKERGVRRLTFANRTYARAEEAAAEFGGGARSLEDLAPAVAGHDVVVACVEAERPLLDVETVSSARWVGREVPKVFVDLSIPRAVHPGLSGFRDALLFDLDALEVVVSLHRESRRAEMDRADRIIVDEVHKFLALRTYAAISPLVADLRDRFESVRAEWLAARGAAPGGDLDAASRDLSKRLLATALTQMKEGAKLSQSAAALERSYRRYLERIE